MTPVTDRSFGLLIAFLIPGFSVILLWGDRIPAVAAWLTESPQATPSVGGFLYVTVASIAVGLVLSTVRWALLDKLHHVTGLKPPRIDPSTSGLSLDAYRLAVDMHYRYYQFYGSSLLVLLLLLLVPPGGPAEKLFTTPISFMALLAGAALFFAASRDALSKCYSRGSPSLEITDSHYERTDTMTNGGPYAPGPAPAPPTNAPVADGAATTSPPRTESGSDKTPNKARESDVKAEK